MKTDGTLAYCLLALALCGVAGCGNQSDSQEALSQTNASPTRTSDGWPSTNAVAADRHEWNRRTLVIAYDAAGERDPRWDAAAREALEAFALVRCGTDTNAPRRLEVALGRAEEAGCKDPLITYLNLRYLHGMAVDADDAGAEAYREAAERMRLTDYPEIRKFYTALRAAQALKSAYGSNSRTTKLLGAFRRGAFEHLREALREPDIPFDEACDAAEELYQTIVSNSKQENDMFPILIDCLESRWPIEARGLNLCGRVRVQLAWNARGSGYADSVTEKGWDTFARHLAEAERVLERSWDLDPTLESTAVEMMRVELGQGKGRNRMELWFSRAMKLNPANYEAARAKVWYLQPKWHGADGDAISFGRECVRSTEWKGRVPLVLWDAHRMLANDAAAGLKDAHWKQRGVWEDVRSSFERFEELNPGDTSALHDYASCAYKCEQHDQFLELLGRIQPVNYTYFGSEQRLAEMVAFAKLKSVK